VDIRGQERITRGHDWHAQRISAARPTQPSLAIRVLSLTQCCKNPLSPANTPQLHQDGPNHGVAASVISVGDSALGPRESTIVHR
jgi:hypothetical protein